MLQVAYSVLYNMSLVFVDIYKQLFFIINTKKELQLHISHLRNVCCQITIKQIDITGILILLENVSEKKDAEWMLHQKAAWWLAQQFGQGRAGENSRERFHPTEWKQNSKTATKT